MNSYIFFNDVKIYKFKARDSEINLAPIWLGNVSKDFSADKVKKTGLWRYFYDVSLDRIDLDDILDIYRYLLVKGNMK